MVSENGQLTEELLSYLISPNFTELTKAEQIAQGKALLYRLETALEEYRQNAGETPRGLARKSPSLELPQLIGEVVIAAAWAEDAAGTLLQASSGVWKVRAKGYDDTSSSLVKALKAVVPVDLIGRLETALRLRHFVVHGFFVDGSFVKHPTTGEPYDFVSMKRSWRTEAPEREVKAFTVNALRWLAQEFWEIEGELERLHSEVIFGRVGEDSD